MTKERFGATGSPAPSTHRPEQRASLARKLLIALLSASLTLALAESLAWQVLAGLGNDHAPLRLDWDGHPASERAASLRDHLYRPDPTCFFRLKPDLDLVRTASRHVFDVHTNSLGLRGGELQEPRPPGSVRVLCVGDSCTFGTGVGQGDTYPAVLEATLRRSLSTPDVEVLNAGVPGYTSYQCLRYLELEGYDLAPDVILLCSNYNDASVANAGAKRTIGEGRMLTDRQYGQELRPDPRFALQRLARRWGRGPEAAAPTGQRRRKVRRVPLVDYREHLTMFIEGCRARGIRPVLVLWPLRTQAGSLQEFPTDRVRHRTVREYQEIVVKVAHEQGALLVDLRPVVMGRPEWFVHPVHLTVDGYARVSQTIASALEDKLER